MVELAVALVLACPFAAMVALALPSAALAPEPGAANVTTPFCTGSLNALLTVVTKGAAKAVLTTVVCALPEVRVKVNPRDSKAPMSTVPCCGRVIPRWSLAGAPLGGQ